MADRTANPVDVAGYTLWLRNGRIEIWNYWTDRLVHTTEPVWKVAYEWAFDHSLIPPVPERCWPYQYPDGEIPLPARKRRAKP